MKRANKPLALMLVIALVLGLVGPTTGLAAAPSDIRGHWARNYITDGVNRGYIDGYSDGTFRPDDSVTRAEFCKMINNALGLQRTAVTSFTDIPANAWYGEEVRRAVAAGYISGYQDGTFRANDSITRQEAAVVLSRVCTPPSELGDVSKMKDRNSIEAWALPAVRAVYSKGYMTGDEKQNFDPNGRLTRGEAAKVIEEILSREAIVKGDQTISSAGQNYNSCIYTGDVTISSAVSNSSTVTLNNCRVLGETTVSGGAELLLNNVGLNILNVANTSDATVIRASGFSSVKETKVTRGCSLIEGNLNGSGFENVTMSGSALRNTDVRLSGDFDEVTLNSEIDMWLDSGSIRLLTVNSGAGGSEITLVRNTRVEKAVVNTAVNFYGAGKIVLAQLASNSVSFETQPDQIVGQVALTASASPRDGARDVSLGSKITLTFSDALLNGSGKTLTTTDITEEVIDLRRDNQTGTSVRFTASISSNRKVITITPKEELKRGTTYYVILGNKTLTNSDGASNTRQVFSFSTTGAMSPTTYPVDGSDTVPVGTGIKLIFGEDILRGDDGKSITADYLKDSVITLRRGSSTGPTVDFKAKLESDKKTITITPDSKLVVGTRYYVTVAANSLQNSSGEKNGQIRFSFTTADSDVLVPVVNPPSGSEAVSRTPLITLTFDTALFTNSGSIGVDGGYLEDSVFTLRRGSSSGTASDISITIDNARKVVSIQPKEQLRADETYYLVMARNTLANGAGSARETNIRLVFSFTTNGDEGAGTIVDSITPRNGTAEVDVNSKVILKFESPLKDTAGKDVTTAYFQKNVLEVRVGSSTGSLFTDYTLEISKEKDQLTITPTKTFFAPDTRYYIILKGNTLQNTDGERNGSFSSSFTTGGARALMAQVTPAHNSTGARTDTSVILDFDEILYQKDGVTQIRSNDISREYVEKNVVKLYVDKASGTAITCDVSVSARRITLTPRQELTIGKTYYVVLKKDTLSNVDGVKNDAQTYQFTVGTGLTVALQPESGAINVDRSPSLTVTFSDGIDIPVASGNQSMPLDLNNSTHLAYVKSKIKLTGSSGAVDYNVSVNGSRKVLTLWPTSTLTGNTEYKLSVDNNAFMGSTGGTNSAISTNFTTRGKLTPPEMTSPSDGSGTMTPDGAITLYFPEAVQGVISGSWTANDVKVAVELREGSRTGPVVAYDVDESTLSGGRSCTIKPQNDLKRGVTYYVLIKEGTLLDKAKGEIPNEAVSFSFTVGSLQVTSFTPVGDRVPPGNTITLTFNARLVNNNGVLDEDYLKSKFTVRAGGTTLGATAFNISASGGSRTVVTITLAAPMQPGTAYTVSAMARALTDDTGSTNVKTITCSFITAP